MAQISDELVGFVRLGYLEMVNGAFGRFALEEIRHGANLLWTAIRSCFGSGHWINEKPWVNSDGWKNE